MQVFREMTIFEVSENGNDDVLRNMTILSFVKFGIVTPFQKKWQLQIFLNDDVITFTREGEYERFLSANGVRTAFFRSRIQLPTKIKYLTEKIRKK